MNTNTLHVSSMVSMKTREARVTFYMEPPTDAWTMSIEEAKHHALAVIEAMNAAITDAFLVAFLTEEFNLDDQQMAVVLNKFRDYRQMHGMVL